MNIDLKKPVYFYSLLLITVFLELYAFYVLKRKNYWVGIPTFALVGVMHSFLFVAKGIAHSHAIYHVVTIVLVTMLGIHDHEHVNEYMMRFICFKKNYIIIKSQKFNSANFRNKAQQI